MIVGLSVRNVLRNKRRTALTLMSIVVGVGGLVLFNGFIEYSLWGLRESTIQSGLGHIQVASEDKFFVSGTYDPFTYLLPKERDMVAAIRAEPEVKTVIPQIRFTGTMSLDGRSGIVMLSANDPEIASDLYGFRSIVEGRELRGKDAQKVILGKGVAEKLDAKVGSSVTVLTATNGGGANAVDLEVVGICALGSRDLENVMAYTTLATAQELLSVETSPLLVVVLKETGRTAAAAAAIASRLSGLGAPSVVKTWEELADYYRQARDLYANMLDVVQVIILLIVVFAIANTMMMAIMERTREIGTIRAIGTRSAHVFTMFLVEATLIGLCGGALGVAAGYGLSYLINLAGGVYIPPPPGRSDGYYALFHPDIRYAAKILGLAALVSLASSAYPSLRAIRAKIPECLRHL